MKDKILILGTSNSLLKDGYGAKLLSNSKFERYSIGDTTNLSGIYNLLRIKELSKYKYAILDFYVNELTFMVSINYPFTWIVSSFMCLIKYLISEGVLPIIVIIDKDGFRWLGSYQRQIANKFVLRTLIFMMN